jgi:hypothetical protein
MVWLEQGSKGKIEPNTVTRHSQFQESIRYSMALFNFQASDIFDAMRVAS